MFLRFMCVATIALLTGPCFPVKETLPPEPKEPAPDETAHGGIEHVLTEPPQSAVLDDNALHHAVATLWPSAARYALERKDDRELLAAFPAAGARPIGLASLTRIGWTTGSVGMVVSVDAAGARIARVLTLSPKGAQDDFQRYREAKDGFLGQFEGRPVGTVGGIRVIDGARRFCQSLTRCIESEARALGETAADSDRLTRLADEAWELPPKETVLPRPLNTRAGASETSPATSPPAALRRGERTEPGRDASHVWLDPPILVVLMVCVTTLLVTLILATRRG